MGRWREKKGQSLVEFALLLPVLLIILLGLLDLGRAYYILVTLKDMASEGASYAAMHPADVWEIRQRASDGGGGLVTVVSSTISVEAGATTVTVTVPYSYNVLTPFINGLFPDGFVPLRARASQRILSTSP